MPLSPLSAQRLRFVVGKHERERTDGSLGAERSRSDEELADKRAAIEADADRIIARARTRANAILERERALSDRQIPEVASREAVSEERRREDHVLSDERADADRQLGRERQARYEAVAALFAEERARTDKHLADERTGSDDAITARDTFLGMVSHDLRTMLGGLSMGAASLLEIPCEGEVRERVHRDADRIKRYTMRMNRLVGDLLDVVSMEAGKLHVRPQPHEANVLVRETMEAFQPVAAARGVSLIARVFPGSLLAEFDHERVLQVLANLVGNALKFSGEGGTIALVVEPIDGQVRFTVADDGPGIESEKLDLIFELYGQATRYDRQGLGLGLYISRRIVEAHAGRLWVDSRPGEGSAFSFTLPAPAPSVAS